MTARSELNGRKVIFESGQWIYEDTREPTPNKVARLVAVGGRLWINPDRVLFIAEDTVDDEVSTFVCMEGSDDGIVADGMTAKDVAEKMGTTLVHIGGGVWVRPCTVSCLNEYSDDSPIPGRGIYTVVQVGESSVDVFDVTAQSIAEILARDTNRGAE